MLYVKNQDRYFCMTRSAMLFLNKVANKFGML